MKSGVVFLVQGLLFLVYCVGEQIEFQFTKLVGIPKEVSSQEA